MNALRVRKNFLFDSDVVEKAGDVLRQKHKSMTEAINSYLQAIVKDPSLVDSIDAIAVRRNAAFIGVLDDEIGDESFKQMKQSHHERLS